MSGLATREMRRSEPLPTCTPKLCFCAQNNAFLDLTTNNTQMGRTRLSLAKKTMGARQYTKVSDVCQLWDVADLTTLSRTYLLIETLLKLNITSINSTHV